MHFLTKVFISVCTSYIVVPRFLHHYVNRTDEPQFWPKICNSNFFFFFFFLQYNENAPKMGDFVWIFLKLFSAWYLWKREAANQVKLFLCLDKISISSLFLKKAWNWGKFVVLQMVIYYISSLQNQWRHKQFCFGGAKHTLAPFLQNIGGANLEFC